MNKQLTTRRIILNLEIKMNLKEKKILKLITNKAKYNAKTKLGQIDSFDLIDIVIKLEKLLKKK